MESDSSSDSENMKDELWDRTVDVIRFIEKEDADPIERLDFLREYKEFSQAACEYFETELKLKSVRPRMNAMYNRLDSNKKEEKPHEEKPSIDLEAESGEEGNPIDVDSVDKEEKI